jgi:hypothetical protein
MFKMFYFLYMLKSRHTERLATIIPLGNKVVTVMRVIMVTQCTDRMQHEEAAGNTDSVGTWICQQ